MKTIAQQLVECGFTEDSDDDQTSFEIDGGLIAIRRYGKTCIVEIVTPNGQTVAFNALWRTIRTDADDES